MVERHSAKMRTDNNDWSGTWRRSDGSLGNGDGVGRMTRVSSGAKGKIRDIFKQIAKYIQAVVIESFSDQSNCRRHSGWKETVGNCKSREIEEVHKVIVITQHCIDTVERATFENFVDCWSDAAGRHDHKVDGKIFPRLGYCLTESLKLVECLESVDGRICISFKHDTSCDGMECFGMRSEKRFDASESFSNKRTVVERMGDFYKRRHVDFNKLTVERARNTVESRCIEFASASNVSKEG